jgi:hypothetical protein
MTEIAEGFKVKPKPYTMKIVEAYEQKFEELNEREQLDDFTMWYELIPYFLDFVEGDYEQLKKEDVDVRAVEDEYHENFIPRSRRFMMKRVGF